MTNEHHKPNSADVVTDRSQVFCYDLDAAPLGQKLQLLTVGGVALYGQMTRADQRGDQGIIAWHPLPVRDKEEEKRRGIRLTGSVL
jgi:hypothetical protein